MVELAVGIVDESKKKMVMAWGWMVILKGVALMKLFD